MARPATETPGYTGSGIAIGKGMAMDRMTLERVTASSAVMGGKPCVRGTRVTVGTIVGLVAAEHEIDDILAAYPYLEREDITGDSMWKWVTFAAGLCGARGSWRTRCRE